MTFEQVKVLEDAIKTFGIDNQSDIAIEEMSELTKAIIKHRRYNTEETREQIKEEIADVQIMVYQLMILYGEQYGVWDIIDSKIERLKKRIEDFKNESQVE